jgi:hypothetical protein
VKSLPELSSNTYRFDELLGAVLSGKGDETEGLGLVILHLVHRSDNLHHLAGKTDKLT